MFAVQVAGSALKHAAPQFRCDADVCRAAVDSDGLALEFVGEVTKAQRANLETRAVATDGGAVRFVRAGRLDLFSAHVAETPRASMHGIAALPLPRCFLPHAASP